MVPRGKSATVYIDINGPGKVALREGGWRLTSSYSPFEGLYYKLERTFSQGISELKLDVNLDNCNCVTYASPYLEATTAYVLSDTVSAAGSALGLLLGGPPWPVSLSFRQSEVDAQYSSLPSDLSIVAAYPQAPTNTAAPNDWSWLNADRGSVTAIDLGASGNRDMHLFYAGLIFGIAGSAVIASVQAFVTFMTTRGKRNDNIPSKLEK